MTAEDLLSELRTSRTDLARLVEAGKLLGVSLEGAVG